MSRITLAFAVAALVFSGAAPAQATLRMYGDARPRHWNWAREAQAHVPLPDVRVRFHRYDCGLYGGACYEPGKSGRHGVLYLPGPQYDGWGYENERLLFLHELGHAFDYRHLDRSERDRFRTLVGTGCSWMSQRCFLAPGYNVPPAEMFAEIYAACALGLTRAEVEARGLVSYGWRPPADKDGALCDLIRSAA